MPAATIPTTSAGPKLLEEMTSHEVREALKHTDVAMLATGAIEQHGAHLPLGTDWYLGLNSTRNVVKALADRGHQIVAYVLPVGKSDLFKTYPGTLTLSNSTFVAVQKDILKCLHSQGFKRFVLLSSNGGNSVTSALAASEAYAELGAPVLFIDPMQRGPSGQPSLLKNPKLDSHGGEGETSVMLHARPDLVHIDRAKVIEPNEKLERFHVRGAKRMHDKWEEISPWGHVGDPSLAEAETGRKLSERSATWIADAIETEYFSGK